MRRIFFQESVYIIQTMLKVFCSVTITLLQQIDVTRQTLLLFELVNGTLSALLEVPTKDKTISFAILYSSRVGYINLKQSFKEHRIAITPIISRR